MLDSAGYAYRRAGREYTPFSSRFDADSIDVAQIETWIALSQSVVAKDQPAVQNLGVIVSTIRAIRQRCVLDQHPRLQTWPILFPDPRQFELVSRQPSPLKPERNSAGETAMFGNRPRSRLSLVTSGTENDRATKMYSASYAEQSDAATMCMTSALDT